MWSRKTKARFSQRVEPRVTLTYQTIVDGSEYDKELPVVIGVLGSFSGVSDSEAGAMKDRGFCEINTDNFDDVLESYHPRVVIRSPGPYGGSEGISVELHFSKLDDFLPENVDGKGRPLEMILNHPGFLALEATWRGLFYLVSSTAPHPLSKVRILDIGKEELKSVLTRHKDLNSKNPMVRKLYIETFCQCGGEPFSCLVGDYYFDESLEDTAMLTQLAHLSALAMAPFISGASPNIFGRKSWRDWSSEDQISCLANRDHMSSAGWRSLRESACSAFLGLTLPRVLVRPPYRITTDSDPVWAVPGEASEGLTQACFANAAYAMAANIRRSYQTFGWPARIRGLESGGVIVEPPHCKKWTGNLAETVIADRPEAELAKAGLMTMVQGEERGGTACFRGAQSLLKPAEADDWDRKCDAMLQARFPYILAVCRFAQYLHCLYRDSWSVAEGPKVVEERFAAWLTGYVGVWKGGEDDAELVKQPLSSAAVSVTRSSALPDLLYLSIAVNPYYQLYGMTGALCLRVKLVANPSRVEEDSQGVDLNENAPVGVFYVKDDAQFRGTLSAVVPTDVP